MPNKKTYTIYWLIVDKKELTAEMHSLGFSQKEDYEDQIDYLTKIHRNRRKKLKVFYENDKTCHIIVGL